MSKSVNIVVIASCILILLSLTFSMSHYLPILQRMWLFVALGFVLPAIACPSFYGSKVFLSYLLYIMMVSISYLIGRSYFTTSGYFFRETYIMIIPAGLFYLFTKQKDNKMGNTLLITFISILVYTTILSFIINLSFPGIIRSAFTAGRVGGAMEAISESYYKIGLSSYEFPHALPILIPALLAVVLHGSVRTIIKFLFLIILVLTLVLIYISGSTTALGLAALILVISFFIREKSFSRNTKSLILILLISLPILLNKDVQLGFLDYIDEIIGLESGQHGKIMDIEESIKYGSDEGTVGARTERYNMTWNVFLNNMLFGGDGGGGHSALLDRLSTLGLIGFFPYILFIVAQVKYTVLFIPKQIVTYYYVGILAGIIMLASKNMSNWYLWLCMFTILPIILILFFKKSVKNEDISRHVSVAPSGSSVHTKN